jgi:hypothetical protein
VSIMKSVPNLISYLHEFFRNFSQFLAIFFELFSYGGFILIQKSTDAWGPPVSGSVAPRRARIGCCGRRCLNVPGGLKAAPTAPFGQPLSERTPSSRPRRCPSSPRPSRRVPTVAVRRRALARSEADAVASEPSTPPSTPPRR